MIGTSFGPYLLDELIGRGGMGEVYRARDREHEDRLVAVKLLPESVSGDPEYRTRFRREAEHAAGLTDPHIPVIHRYGEIDGRLFMDMELVAGRDLATIVREEGPLSPAFAVGVVEQVAAALDCAHRAGLVHRDVKPSNVLVDTTGPGPHAKLIDFGIAARADPDSRTALTRTGAVIGTLAYTAPERFLAHRVGPPADVYSLACVLYELLTGQRPFPVEGVAASIAAHLEQPPPRASMHRPDLPAGLDAVITRGMAKDPAARYPSAGALGAAARAALHAPRGEVTVAATLEAPVDLPTLLSPDREAPHLPPTRVRRSRAWLAPAGIGAALGALVLVVALLGWTAGGSGGAPLAAPAPTVQPSAPPSPQALPVAPARGPIAERVFVGVSPMIEDVNVAYLGATPVLLTGGSVRVLDLVTGERLGAATGGDPATVVEHRGVPVLLTAGYDNVIRVLDLSTGQPQATTLAGHTETVSSIAARHIDGRTIVASVSFDDTVRLWDLDTGQPIGSPLPAEPDVVDFVDVGGRPAVVAAGLRSIRAWDAVTGAPIGTPIDAQRMFGQGLPVGTVAGRTIAATTALGSGGGLPITLHDLATGTPVGAVTIQSSDVQSPVAIVELGGRALLFYADGAEIVQYDLLTGSPVGDRLTGHEADVDSLKVITAEGRTYLLSGSADRSVRVWDLTARNGG